MTNLQTCLAGETVETVAPMVLVWFTGLKPGVNESKVVSDF
jgi:hypothetical protein